MHVTQTEPIGSGLYPGQYNKTQKKWWWRIHFTLPKMRAASSETVTSRCQLGIQPPLPGCSTFSRLSERKTVGIPEFPTCLNAALPKSIDRLRTADRLKMRHMTAFRIWIWGNRMLWKQGRVGDYFKTLQRATKYVCLMCMDQMTPTEEHSARGDR